LKTRQNSRSLYLYKHSFYYASLPKPFLGVAWYTNRHGWWCSW